MTEAICISCGEVKRGAFNKCENCGAMPRSDDELMLSFALTSHHFSLETLQETGQDIKLGKLPQLDEADRKRMYPAILEVKRMLGIDDRATREAAPPSRGISKWRFALYIAGLFNRS